jgi:hypothetical protein
VDFLLLLLRRRLVLGGQSLVLLLHAGLLQPGLLIGRLEGLLGSLTTLSCGRLGRPAPGAFQAKPIHNLLGATKIRQTIELVCTKTIRVH